MLLGCLAAGAEAECGSEDFQLRVREGLLGALLGDS